MKQENSQEPKPIILSLFENTNLDSRDVFCFMIGMLTSGVDTVSLSFSFSIHFLYIYKILIKQSKINFIPFYFYLYLFRTFEF